MDDETKKPLPVRESAGGDPAGEGRRRGLRLVPRLEEQGYRRDLVERRRRWAEKETGSRLEHLGRFSFDSEEMRGNVENPIGAAQVPVGLAGPLKIDGQHARGTFFVPMATTEGAMVRSYERGMVALTRSGGAQARVSLDENRTCPIFGFEDLAQAQRFADAVPDRLEEMRRAAAGTTRHGMLLGAEAVPLGRQVILRLSFSTGDAHGMNMIVKATEAICQLLLPGSGARDYLLFSGAAGEKRAGGGLLAGGKGKRVSAAALLPRRVVEASFHATPEEMADLWRRTVVGHLQAGALGYSGQSSNGLTALAIACGQDVANVVNSATAITQFEVTADGDLHASVTLPSLIVATVGGGTSLGTGRECLEILGCAGSGKARKLAEIAAATVLAGDLSMAGAIASGEFVAAHEAYGRNRPTVAETAGEATEEEA